MNRKSLITITLLCWSNIGLFYLLYQLRFEPVWVGVLRELTLFPSFLVGLVCPLLIVFTFFKKKNN
ncbi:MAG: hypothetical protein ACON43_00545 [Flavobacteriaceae bacterium]